MSDSVFDVNAKLSKLRSRKVNGMDEQSSTATIDLNWSVLMRERAFLEASSSSSSLLVRSTNDQKKTLSTCTENPRMQERSASKGSLRIEA